MITLTDFNDLVRVPDPDIRSLLRNRFVSFGLEPGEQLSDYGRFVVVQPGDAVASVEAACGVVFFSNVYSDTRYGDANFVPKFEILDEHPTCYELVYVLDAAGFGAIVFVPKLVGVDDTLTRFCRDYAVPAAQPCD